MQADDLIHRAATGVLAVAIAILAVTAGATAVPAVKNRIGWPAGAPATYVVGQQIDVPSQVYSGTARTVLFFTQNNCGACQRSKAAMTSIASNLSKRSDIRVVMVTGTTFRQDETAFARSIGIDSSRMLRVDLTKLRVKHVPATVIVNASGRILLAQEGLLSESQSRDIVAAASSK